MSASMDRYFELLSAYIDGEASDSERSEVERLLAENKEAAELYSRLSATRNMLSSMQPMSAPSRVRHNVSHAIRASHRSFFARMRRLVTPRRLRMPVLTYAGSAIVIVLAVLFLVVIPQVTDTTNTEQIADTSVGDSETRLQESEPMEGLAPPSLEDSTRQETKAESAHPSNSEEQQELLAEFEADAPIDSLEETRAGRELQRAPSRSRVGISAAPNPEPIIEPTIVSVGARPTMYRAEVIQAFRDTPITSKREKADSESYIASSNEMRLDHEASSGADTNPIVESVDLGAIGMPAVDFPHFQSVGTGSVMISGQIHVASDGHVISYSLSGPGEFRELIDRYAAHLAGTRMMPALHEGRPVSVLYNFIATIYRIEDPAD